MEDILLEPLKAYTESYDKLFDENAENYFADLVKKSNIDVELNRSTVKALNKEIAHVKRIEKEQSKLKRCRGLLIALIVFGVLFFAIGLYAFITAVNFLWLISVFAGVAAIAVSSAVICNVVNPRLRRHDEEKSEREEKSRELYEQCCEQTAPLNALFESSATKYLIEKTVGKIVVDDNFDMRRYDYLSGKYGFGDNDDTSRSTIAVLSGEILGNPFVVDRELVEEMGTKKYTGSLTIHWTTSYTDSQGRRHTQHHSQTLYASLDKPCPYYNEQTRLIYGNEAAPSLCFTHEPSHAERYSEKELERHVRKQGKKLHKLQRKAMTDDDPSTNFTEMGNAKFDALFGAVDRNNEVEFRVLFTPLAQKNMLDLLTDKNHYGDDFYFYKRGCLNYVSSEHSSEWDFDTSYKRYFSHDVDDSFNKFLTFNKHYFKSLYFELAPILSIPVYQQLKPVEYIYQTEYFRNYTCYEAECAVNGMGYSKFEHAESVTPSILKTKLLSKQGGTDTLEICAYSYKTVEHVESVPVFGGDGLTHLVPVVWQEYVPLVQMSNVKLKQLEITDKEYENEIRQGELPEVLSAHGSAANYLHKLLCCLVTPQTVDSSFDEDINVILKKLSGGK